MVLRFGSPAQRTALVKLEKQVGIIRLRVAVRPGTPGDVARMWARAAQTIRQSLNFSGLKDSLPERICTYPACESLDQDQLMLCSACSTPYCSQACQKA